jgi:hypothetical protein
MRRTAGAGIHALDRYDADVFRERKLCAIDHRGKLLGARIRNTDGKIFENGLVCKILHAIEHGTIHNNVNIKGYDISKVEANVFRTVQTMQDARNDMLACVALHALKAKRKIYLTRNDVTHIRRTAEKMENTPFPLLNVQNLEAAERSAIRTLTAALGKEGRGIRFHKIAAHAFRNGEHAR